MGQWNPSVFDNSYSSKIPMNAIRSLAGFWGNHKIYFNTRTTVEPPESLLKATPIGGWCYDSYDAVVQAAEPGKHQTAINTLAFFKELNRIFLQDAAATMVLAPDRGTHQMFLTMPVLQTDDFKVS